MEGWANALVQVPAICALGFIFYRIAGLLINVLGEKLDRIADAILKQAEQQHEMKDALRANTAVLERLLDTRVV